MVRKKDMSEYELIFAGMSVLERQIQGRAGEWVLRNGSWWDEGLHAYVKKCACCHHLFLSKRADKKTCQESCKKKRARTNAAHNLKNGVRNTYCF